MNTEVLRTEKLNNILLLLLLYHIKVLRVKHLNPEFRLFIISISLIFNSLLGKFVD